MNINKPLSEIHKVVCDSNSLLAAAKQLGISLVTLKKHLYGYHYQSKALTYAILKKITIEQAQEEWGEAYQQSIRRKNDIREYTIADLHNTTRETNTLADAAAYLGVSSQTLGIQLGKLKYRGESLTYHTMKELTGEQAKEEWGEAYQRPLETLEIKITDLNQYTSTDFPLPN